MPLGSEAVHCTGCTASLPQVVWQRIAGVPLLRSDHPLGRAFRSPSWWARALQEMHCPLHLGSVAVHDRISTPHCPYAVRKCIVGVALPTAPMQ